MNSEYGIERYAELLAGYFKDNPGDPGLDGSSNLLVAKGITGFSLLPSNTITIQYHSFTAGELTPDDTIIINLWTAPYALNSFSVALIWETASGDQITFLNFANMNAESHYVFSIGQATGVDTAICDNSYLIATTFQSIIVGNKSTSIVQILNADATPKHNWITEGSALVATVTAGAPAGLGAMAYGQFYVSCMKRT